MTTFRLKSLAAVVVFATATVAAFQLGSWLVGEEEAVRPAMVPYRDAGQKGEVGKSVPTDEPALTRVQAGGLDYGVPPFTELISEAGGALEGSVKEVSSVQWNLPEGEKYDPDKDYAYPITYRTATIAVSRWFYYDGSFADKEVVVTLAGGYIERDLTAEEVIKYNAQNPGTVEPGGTILEGEQPNVGGLDFVPGEHVAVLVGTFPFNFAKGSSPVTQIPGLAAAKFLVEGGGSLRNSVVARPGAPSTIEELTEMVRRVKEGN